MSLLRLGLLGGLIGPILWLVLIAVAGAMTPHFDHSTHYISELAAHGSATETWMRVAAFGFTGFLYVCFAVGLSATMKRTGAVLVACALIAVEGAGRIGAGVFACDPGCVRVSSTQDLHKLLATIGFVSGILAALAWGVLFRGLTRFERLSPLSVACGLIAAVALLLMSWDANPVNAPGFFEHLATVVLSLWIVLFAASALRHDARH
jgi:hypothetical membrane protein